MKNGKKIDRFEKLIILVPVVLLLMLMIHEILMVRDGSSSQNSGWTTPNAQLATYTMEVSADDATIDLSDWVIAEPVHAQTRIQICVTKRFKLSKKHAIKHLKHRKQVVNSL